MVILSAVSIYEVDCSKFLLRFQFRDRCYRDNAGLNLYEGIFVCVCVYVMYVCMVMYWVIELICDREQGHLRQKDWFEEMIVKKENMVEGFLLALIIQLGLFELEFFREFYDSVSVSSSIPEKNYYEYIIIRTLHNSSFFSFSNQRKRIHLFPHHAVGKCGHQFLLVKSPPLSNASL